VDEIVRIRTMSERNQECVSVEKKYIEPQRRKERKVSAKKIQAYFASSLRSLSLCGLTLIFRVGAQNQPMNSKTVSEKL